MTKPYTEDEFSAQITEGRAWRIKEISDLKTATIRADAIAQRVLLRALVTVCYAHWEGYVKFTAKKYLEHIALKKLSYYQLNRQFIRNLFIPRLGALQQSKASIKERCKIVDEILDCNQQRFSRVNADIVNTKANLNFDVLGEICRVCDINDVEFADEESFIDVMLLKRRNAIAHGEETFVEIESIDEISDKTIELMRRFGDALENAVVLKAYKSDGT